MIISAIELSEETLQEFNRECQIKTYLQAGDGPIEVIECDNPAKYYGLRHLSDSEGIECYEDYIYFCQECYDEDKNFCLYYGSCMICGKEWIVNKPMNIQRDKQ